MAYEGCHGLLTYGRVCALGVVARRARSVGSYQGTAHSCDKDGHVCKGIGEGISLYNFIVKTQIGIEDVKHGRVQKTTIWNDERHFLGETY